MLPICTSLSQAISAQKAGGRPSSSSLGYSYQDIAHAAGLNFRNYCGGETSKKYILETTSGGAALFDYDNDGWLDIFLVNGWRLDGFPAGNAPTNRLFRNNHNGVFTDVTEKAGLIRHGWGQGVCIGDYDNDGFEDLFVTYWGHNVLYHNNGDGTFTDVSERAGVAGSKTRWGTGCAFLDYDRDGLLDLFVANYLVFDPKTAPDPGTNPYCIYRGLSVNCGPRGLQGEAGILYHNNGNGTFTDVSEQAGVMRPSGYYGLGVLVADYDNDGWPDIYVADDDTPSVLFHNNHNGTFTDIAVMAGCAYDENGAPQSGMGASAGDYDRDGWLDIFKTNFSDQTPNLYHNEGRAIFADVTFQAGTARHDRYVGWGCGFFDPDNDGWLDLFYCNGHVYPELEAAKTPVKYREPRVLYRNLRNGRFEDVSARAGSCITTPSTSRGCAFGDFDNDGDVDIVINNQNDRPSLLRCDRQNSNHWITLRTIGVKSNRSGIGTRVRCVTGDGVQIDEVRSGGGYLSQNDLRVHFGLGAAEKVDLLELRWPSGHVDTLRNLAVDQIIVVKEGGSNSRVM
ncbi:MAG TPA: CRTAC1 family protein [Terriglobia bacterium]|nr:CRTAC1 family protein [Terriglobia bacterium]